MHGTDAYALKGGETVSVDFVPKGQHAVDPQFAEVRIGDFHYQLVNIDPTKGLSIYKNRIRFTLPVRSNHSGKELKMYFRIDQPRTAWHVVVTVEALD